MLTLWACNFPGGETSYHDTELEAASRVAYLVQSKTAFVAVCWQIVIEPPVRVGYWERERENAA